MRCGLYLLGARELEIRNASGLVFRTFSFLKDEQYSKTLTLELTQPMKIEVMLLIIGKLNLTEFISELLRFTDRNFLNFNHRLYELVTDKFLPY